VSTPCALPCAAGRRCKRRQPHRRAGTPVWVLTGTHRVLKGTQEYSWQLQGTPGVLAGYFRCSQGVHLTQRALRGVLTGYSRETPKLLRLGVFVCLFVRQEVRLAEDGDDGVTVPPELAAVCGPTSAPVLDGLTPPTSAPGLDGLTPAHICPRTGLSAHICTGTGTRWAHPRSRLCAGTTWAQPQPTSAPGLHAPEPFLVRVL
jgi:hypothetical protein